LEAAVELPLLFSDGRLPLDRLCSPLLQNRPSRRRLDQPTSLHFLRVSKMPYRLLEPARKGLLKRGKRSLERVVLALDERDVLPRRVRRALERLERPGSGGMPRTEEVERLARRGRMDLQLRGPSVCVSSMFGGQSK